MSRLWSRRRPAAVVCGVWGAGECRYTRGGETVCVIPIAEWGELQPGRLASPPPYTACPTHSSTYASTHPPTHHNSQNLDKNEPPRLPQINAAFSVANRRLLLARFHHPHPPSIQRTHPSTLPSTHRWDTAAHSNRLVFLYLLVIQPPTHPLRTAPKDRTRPFPARSPSPQSHASSSVTHPFPTYPLHPAAHSNSRLLLFPIRLVITTNSFNHPSTQPHAQAGLTWRPPLATRAPPGPSHL